MEKYLETTETLVSAVNGGGPPLGYEPVVTEGGGMVDDGDRVLKGCEKGFNGDLGSNDGVAMVGEKGIVEGVSVRAVMDRGEEGEEGVVDEVNVESVVGCGVECGKGLGSESRLDLDVEMREANGVEKIGAEIDVKWDGTDRKVETEGNGIFLVVEAIDSLESGIEGQNKDKGKDGDYLGLTGTVSEIKVLSIGGESQAFEGEVEVSVIGENDEEAVKGGKEVNATKGNGEGAKKVDREVNAGNGEGAKKVDREVNGAKENVEDEDDDDDDIGDEDQEYHVGDFVWGKIRSFPWWPGQIYEPYDASDYALKLKQKDRILVAYFGDGSFSWCNRSQLKPFLQNFEVMSKRSNSRTFLNAVQSAVEEISRLVELEMTCSCLPERDQLKVARPCNGGIKEGVLVPVGEIGKSLVSHFGPKEIVARLRNVAREVSIGNMLELSVLKSWLTAYYRAKGGYTLPLYHHPTTIEGLEDKSKDGMMNGAGVSNPMEVPARGPSEGEVFTSSLSNQSFLKKCPSLWSDMHSQSRKQKSVSELMDDDESPKVGGVVNGNNNDNLSSRKRKNGKSAAETQTKSLSASLFSVKGDRKRKSESSVSPRTTEENTERFEVEGEETEVIPVSAELKRGKLSGSQMGEDGSGKANQKSFPLRERKKSRFLSSPFTTTDGRRTSSFSEKMTKVASRLVGDQSRNKELGSEPKTAEENEMVIDSEDETGIPRKLLSQIRLAARDPLRLRDKSFLHSLTENMAAFRNSFFLNQSGYDEKEECETGSRKRKSSIMSSGPSQGRLNESEHELSEPAGHKQKVRATVQDFEVPLLKKAPEPDMKANDEKEVVPVSLILTFPPAFNLPSKEVLMQIFGKFGALDETETDVFYNSYCARVSYLRSFDAEAAYLESVQRSPFGAANVNFRLRYPPGAAKVHEINPNPSSENATALESSDDEEVQIGHIKEKVKMIMSVLDACDGKVSTEMKVNLEDELKDILEKVGSIKCSSS